MSQARVTDYFSTRKRNRFNQDEVLLNKQKRTHTLLDAADLNRFEANQQLETRTRSKTKLLAAKANSGGGENTETTKTNENMPAEAEAEGQRKTRASARKKQLEELKQRVTRLDVKLSKLSDESQEAIKPSETAPAPAATEPAPPATTADGAAPKAKKKVNMAELKAKIQRFNENLLAIQATTEAPQQDTTSVTKQTTETVKESVPAYVRHKDLASADVDLKCTLTLPTSFARLFDSFKGSDTIVKLLHNRQETCTFLKLKMGIQNITKHTFALKHLGQIKSVYPLAYVYKQEKMFVDFKNDFHLTIAPNLDEIEPHPETGAREFTPSVLLKRVNKFKASLFQIVKECHQAFLASIGISNVDVKDIKRWHPKFELESVAEIAEVELPKSPNEAVACKTGQDLLNIAKDVYSSRIKEAIKDYVGAAEQATSAELKVIGVGKHQRLHTATKECAELTIANKTTTSTAIKATTTTVSKESCSSVETTSTTVTTVSSSAKALDLDDQTLSKLKEKKAQNYSSLLEKIRNKEKTKAFESMIVNSDKEKKTVKYAHYKETIRFLLFFFQAEKKATIELDKVCGKMAENFKAKLNELECRELLSDLCAEASVNESANDGHKWINVIKVRNIAYIQMNKTSFTLNDLWAKCDKLIEQL